MRKLFSLIAIFTCSILYSQKNTSYTDSLTLAIKKQKGSIEKVQALDDLIWNLRKSNPEQALKYAFQSQAISDSISYTKGFNTSLVRIGMLYTHLNNFNEAEKFLLKALEYESKSKYPHGIARAQNQLAILYQKKGDYNTSILYAKAAIENFNKLKNKSAVANVLTVIGYSYKELGLFDKAMKSLLESIELKKEIGVNNRLDESYINLGLLYLAMENYPKTISTLLKAKDEFSNLPVSQSKIYKNLGVAYYKTKKDSLAKFYYKQAIILNKKLKINDPDCYINLGNILYRQAHLDSAKVYYHKSLLTPKNYLTNENYGEVYNNLGNTFSSQNQTDSALYYYNKAYKASKITNDKLLLLEIVNNLSLEYAKTKNYLKAFEKSNEYVTIRDSVLKTYNNAIKIEDNYKSKQKIIELSEKDRQITQAKNKKKSYLISSLIIGCILLSLLFFFIIRGNKQTQKVHKDVEKQLKNQEIKYIHKIIAGQEEIRQKIAQDLHDSIGSTLSILKLHFENVEEQIQNIKATNKKEYHKATKLLDKVYNDVRKISHKMDTTLLGTYGLDIALEDLKENLESSNRIHVELDIHGANTRLENTLEITVYRIIQEMVGNTLKHSKAQNISIQLIQNKEQVQILVEDDGIGFNVKNGKRKGMGLRNIETRIDSLGGTFNIDSTPEKGASLTVEIPIY